MKNLIIKSISRQTKPEDEILPPLEAVLRDGAQKMLREALNAEIDEYIARIRAATPFSGKALATRNGSLPERHILTGIGPLPVKQPRVNDIEARKASLEPFTSTLLPPYMRRTPSIDNLLPVLYLKGISTGECGPALAAILGKKESEISPGVICRLKKTWQEEYRQWRIRRLDETQYIYAWVDGIHLPVRMEEDPKLCVLVVIAVNSEGKKEFLAIEDGYRESSEAWARVLRDLKARGLSGLKLAIGDGALGFWSALSAVFPEVRQQRCWVHKTRNVLDCFPKSVQPRAKEMLHEIFLSPTRAEAMKAYRRFITDFGDKYPKAVQCLSKDEDVLFAFYDFPAAHWLSIRTTNPIESTFATIRLRTFKTRGCCTRPTALTMLFKLGCEAERHWRRLRGFRQLKLILVGRIFEDGRPKAAA